ncbi:MAG TPA: hypothetical protein VEX60_08800 [Pyrinomonadaceae bacterium]|nr:hypothetical protein [Pyrinomonadaceae bacterium]
MGLAELQRTLARIYTDAELRERYFGDPLKVGREIGLSAEDARLLSQMSAAQVNSFADSLHNKRLLGVGKLLAMTRRALGERFDAHFRRYAAAHVQGGTPQYLDDARKFATYLENSLREERIGSGWTLDLLRFEKARVKAADPKRRVVAAFFRHDISRLVRSVARKEETPTVVKRATLALWVRAKRHGPVRYSAFSAPRLLGGGK